MSLLITLDQAEFNYLKDKTGSTAGNLSVQVTKLEAAGYIAVTKGYKGKRPLTTCEITAKGKTAFQQYVRALHTYINPKS